MTRVCAVALAILLTMPAAARGQVFAGDDAENYLRYLQTFRAVPLYPWGVRAFSPAELDRLAPKDTTLPWPLSSRTPAFQWLDPDASARVNTAFPFGYNDGPIWAGRGLTLAAQGGFSARHGGLSLTVAPLAFISQNAAFQLMANGQSGNARFADGANPSTIDQPQRFGNGTYARLDPGQTTVRLDWHALAIGVSTANQYWGPATEFPILIGNNAPGFPHVFLGTSRPVDLWLVQIHGRVIWGRLAQTAYSPNTMAGGVRFGSGVVLDLTSRWVPGLEVGATRFSHRPWPAGGLSANDLLGLFQSGQGRVVNSPNENQVATVFFRWVLPNSGAEVYGEYGRDDYNSNLRDFLEEPDHIGGYTVGFRKVVRRSTSADHMIGVRAEISDLQFSRLAQGRPWVPFYTHGGVTQGHTELGQVIGSPAGVGGAGAVLAVDSYSRRGRWTWSLTRLLRQQRGDPSGAHPDPNGVDVQYAFALERQQFPASTGGGIRRELLTRATAVYELNRDYGRDAFNVNVIVGVRLRLERTSATPKKRDPLVAATESTPPQ